MSNATATLISKGTEKVSRATLSTIQPRLVATQTFRPVPHGELIDTLDKALAYRNIVTANEEFAVSRGGEMMFGVKILEMSNLTGVTAALGIRAANNKSMAIQITIGMQVFVCSNMAFSSNGIALKRKHTSGLNLYEEMVTAVDTFQGRYLTMEQQVGDLQKREITDDEARVLMFTAFDKKMLPLRFLPEVSKNYFTPPHAEFEPRTAWSLHNAFSEVLKQAPPVPAHDSIMRVSKLLGLTSTKGQVIDVEAEVIG